MYQPNSNNNHLYYPNINATTTTHEFYSPLDHTFPSPFLQSSSSSRLSLQNTSYNHNQHQMDQTQNFYEQQQQQQHELFDFHAGPMTRVYSNGDILESFGENCSQEGGGSGGGNGTGTGNGGGGTGRVGRYSAEERKERIERYRNKRNQRNFQKKITYACRKTLADSRPRVKGRFARNGEAEVEVEMEVEVGEGISNNRWCGWEETEGMGMNNLGSMMMTTMAEEYCYDNELWSSLLGEGVLL